MSVIRVGWSPEEVSNGAAYVRKAVDRGLSVGEALVEVFKRHREGQMTSDEP